MEQTVNQLSSAMSLTLIQAVIGTLVATAVIFASRAFPFVLFSRREPPAIIRFIERYIPAMVMAVLLVAYIKDMAVTVTPEGIMKAAAGSAEWFKNLFHRWGPAVLGLGLTVTLHLWKRNSMVSIFGGTILYMVLIRIM